MASKFDHAGLKSMGYFFNDSLELRQIENNEPFKWQGQAHYDVLGDQVTEWIQDYMVHHYKMEEIWLGEEYPEEEESEEKDIAAEEQPLSWDKPSRSGVFTVNEKDVPRVRAKEMKKRAKVNIFVSQDFWQNQGKLLVIVQGSGAVRPGQWARALCINHSLKSGTIFDYLDIAKECGMATIVINPNQSKLQLRVVSEETPLGTFDRKHEYPILGHENHIKHILHVWDHFVAKSPAKEVWMVAHSRGGDSALQLLNYRLDGKLIVPTEEFDDDDDDVEEEEEENTRKKKKNSKKSSASTSSNIPDSSPLQGRLLAIAFTDSVHWIGSAKSNRVVEWVKENAKDWVTAESPLDTPIPSNEFTAGCPCVSAGHKKHEWTSPCAVNSVFSFLLSKRRKPSYADIASHSEVAHITFTPKEIPFSNPPQHIKSVEEEKPSVAPASASSAPSSTQASSSPTAAAAASSSSSSTTATTSASSTAKPAAAPSTSTSTANHTPTPTTSSSPSFLSNNLVAVGALAGLVVVGLIAAVSLLGRKK